MPKKWRINFFVLFFVLFVSEFFALVPGYSYYKKLTIQESQISSGVNSSNNLPILVHIQDLDLRRVSHGGKVQNSNGYDIVFTSSDGTTLIPFQIESYKSTGSSLDFYVWVSAPNVSATANTEFYMYFGNSSVTTDQSSFLVWDNNYKGVYHLNTNEDDATSNGFNLNSSGTNNVSSSIVADGQEITAGQMLSISSTPALQINGDLTLEAWVNFNALQAGVNENVVFSSSAVGETNATNYNYFFNIIGSGVDANKMQLYWENGAGVDVYMKSTVPVSIANGTWHKIAVTRDNTNLLVKFYLDGQQVGTSVPFLSSQIANGGIASALQIGQDQNPSSNDLNAKLDELRISNKARTPEWIEAQYQSEMLGSTLIVYSPTYSTASPNFCACSIDMSNYTSLGAFGGHSYFVSTQTANWHDADSIANSLGGHLVSITSAGENGFLGVNLSSRWIGLSDANVEGIWQWTSGETFSYSNWSLLQPDNLLNSDFVVISALLGTWDDVTDANRLFIVEFDCAAGGPLVANAGTNQLICGNTATMAAAAPLVGSGLWSLQSGGGVFATASSANSSVNSIPNGTNIYKWTVSAPGCVSASSFVSVVTDTVKPLLSCPANFVAFSNPSCNFVLPDYTGLAAASDNCGSVTLSQSPIPGTNLGIGNQTITLTASDSKGNSATCSFVLTVTSPLNPKLVSCGSSYLNETTIGKGNKASNFSCSAYSTPGEDMYYQINVPTGNTKIQVTMSNLVDANDAAAEVFWVGSTCPSNTCLSSSPFNKLSQKFANGTNVMVFDAVGPATYYLVVDAVNDGISSYDITFDCIESGVEFDTYGTCSGDLNNDGIIPKVNNTASLNVQPCQHVTISHDFYIANPNGFEWLDSVQMSLGSCYTNITNVLPNTSSAGFYQSGVWVTNYSSVNNQIHWNFSHTAPNLLFGDGNQGYYSCSVGQTQHYIFSFEADISTLCSVNSDLDISILISDDGIGGSSNNTASAIDIINSNGFSVSNSAPVILNCPANINAVTNGTSCSSIVNWVAPTVSDNCPAATIVQTAGPTSGSSFPKGTTTISYLATDNTGLTSSCSFNVNVIDNVSPVINCPSNIVKSNDLNSCGANVLNAGPTLFSDNCAMKSVQYTVTGASNFSGINDASGNFFNLGLSNVVYSATDSSGNVGTCAFTVSIADTIAPSFINCPDTISVFANSNCLANVSWPSLMVIDNCTGTVISQIQGQASGSNFGTGVHHIVHVATDSYGLTDTCDFVINVIDTVKPSLLCPANVTSYSSSNACGKLLAGLNAIYNDNCFVDSIVYSSSGATVLNGLNDASNNFFNVGLSNILYTVYDSSRNSSSCSFSVNVLDTIKPIVLCPANIVKLNDAANCSATIISAAPVVNENCGVLSVNYSVTGVSSLAGLNDVSGNVFNVGLSSVNYTVLDVSGNSQSCAFTVTVVDTTKPLFVNCPADTTVYASSSSCGATANWIAPVANDNCSSVSVNQVQGGVSGSVFSVGTHKIIYVATDASGLTDTCDFNIIVVDTVAPTITCPNSFTQANNLNSCGATILNISPTYSDNCSVVSIVFNVTGASSFSGNNNASGNLFNHGLNNVVYTISDVNGNSSSCAFSITVTDTLKPIIVNCSSNIVTYVGQTSCGVSVNWAAPTVIDNCPSPTISQIQGVVNGSLVGVGNYAIKYLATDIAGLTDTCSFVVSVVDTIKPVLQCPSSIRKENDLGVCGAVLTNISPVVFENCTVQSTSYTVSGATVLSGSNTANGSLFNLGFNTLTYSVVDASGNSSTCSTVIEIFDTLSVAVAGADMIVCDTLSSISLSANIPGHGIGSWSVVSGSGIFSNPSLANSSISNLDFGINTLVWTISTSPCSFSKDTIVIHVDHRPSSANAGLNQTVCEDNSNVSLNASPILNGTGNWTVLSGTGNFASSQSSSTALSGFSLGPNEYVWTVSNGVCLSSTDTVMVNVDQLPSTAIASSDLIGEGASLNISGNIPAIGTAVWSIYTGAANIDNVNSPTISVSNYILGETVLLWTITNGVCPASVDEVRITYAKIDLPNAISPNGDGSNEFFVVPGIQLDDNVRFVVFNKWGNVVFESDNYKNDFNGLSNDGKELVDDTYYYILEVSGSNKYSGFLIIKRDK